MKLWKDMTPEEKGALLLAYHEGKVIEHTLWSQEGWYGVQKGTHDPLGWHDDLSYRVKPEPKQPREFWVVKFKGFIYSTHTSEAAALDRWENYQDVEIIHVREVLE